jgi:hypothetical protein
MLNRWRKRSADEPVASFRPLQLHPNLCERSPLYKRAVFVLAPAHSGAELLVGALGSLPGVRSVTSTDLFSKGLDSVLGNYLLTSVAPSDYVVGLSRMAEEQVVLAATRCLADSLLTAASRGGERLIEYSPGHIDSIELIAALYPDAQFIQLIRDGRDVVAAGLATTSRERAGSIARSWWVSYARLLALRQSLKPREVRYESMIAAPDDVLSALCVELEMACHPEEVRRAAGLMVDVRPSPPLDPFDRAALEVLAADTLERYGYKRSSDLATRSMRALWRVSRRTRIRSS